MIRGDRRQRHLKILELIATHAIGTQEELADALAREGWTVTQSSVSRDIAALKLVKLAGVYTRPSVTRAPRRDADEQRIVEGVLSFSPAGDSLIVLHTPPGEANRVGVALDRLAWAEVLGNISGDDTIFVATTDRTAQRRVVRRLSGLVDHH
ncbi:MAG: arginine repressor [Gemmatimonadetes bacterium]|nr:arginine repressor [Gemmatimonadota bacterium]